MKAAFRGRSTTNSFRRWSVSRACTGASVLLIMRMSPNARVAIQAMASARAFSRVLVAR